MDVIGQRMLETHGLELMKTNLINLSVGHVLNMFERVQIMVNMMQQ